MSEKKERITWQVPGSDVIHSIPDGAEVIFTLKGLTRPSPVKIRFKHEGKLVIEGLTTSFEYP